MNRRILWPLLLLLFFLPGHRAFASVALLLEEPYGSFGFVNPTGHAAIYLSHVCAASLTTLRRCSAGEYGVVISRYHHVGGYDWLAIPLIPYLYAVDRVAQIPGSATPETEASLRDLWRRKHLQALVPDDDNGGAPAGDWFQLVGALYDRKIFAFEVETTSAKDDALIEKFNHRANRSHFNLLFHNCADFARSVLDFYYPHAVRRSFSADLGITTPKQLAKSLAHYSARHERMEMEEFILPQVEGSVPRSKHVDGVLEALLRKKYVIPIAIFHPYVAAGVAVTYLTGGRFDPAKNGVELDQAEVVQSMWMDRPLPELLEPRLSASESADDREQSDDTSASLSADSASRPPAVEILSRFTSFFFSP